MRFELGLVLAFSLFFNELNWRSLVVLLFGYVLRSFLKKKYIRLIYDFWIISLFMSALDVSWKFDYIKHLNLTVPLYFYISILLGIYGFLMLISKLWKIDAKISDNYRYDNFGFWIIYVTGIMAVLVSIGIKGSIPLFSTNILESRQNLFPMGLGSLVILNQFTIIFLLFLRRKGIRIKFYLAKVCIPLVMLIITSQRILLIETFLIYAFIYLFFDNESSKRAVPTRYYIFGGGLGVLFFWIGSLRGLTELSLTSLDNVFLEQIYIYSGGPALKNFLALSRGLLGDVDLRYGLTTLRAFFHFAVEDYDIGAFFKGPNNATIFSYQYIDWGEFWVFASPFIWLYYVVVMSKLFQVTGKVYGVFLQAVCLAALFFSPLTDRMFDYSTALRLIIFYFALKIVRLRCLG